MAQATYHSERGTKSALLLVKANAFVFSATPVYVPRAAVADKAIGDTFEIPDGFTFVDMVNPETGEVLTSSTGEPLKVLQY